MLTSCDAEMNTLMVLLCRDSGMCGKTWARLAAAACQSSVKQTIQFNSNWYMNMWFVLNVVSELQWWIAISAEDS